MVKAIKFILSDIHHGKNGQNHQIHLCVISSWSKMVKTKPSNSSSSEMNNGYICSKLPNPSLSEFHHGKKWSNPSNSSMSDFHHGQKWSKPCNFF